MQIQKERLVTVRASRRCNFGKRPSYSPANSVFAISDWQEMTCSSAVRASCSKRILYLLSYRNRSCKERRSPRILHQVRPCVTVDYLGELQAIIEGVMA